MASSLITTVGINLITAAAGNASAVEITHIALGDGFGAYYDPAKAQTALRRELVRRPIESRYQLDGNSWHVKTNFPASTAAFDIREMGFFTAAGQLVAVTAGLNFEPRRTGGIDYLIDQDLHFSDVADGLVIVTAPQDDLYDFAVSALHAIARQGADILKLQGQFL
jgi:hypothetical protein